MMKSINDLVIEFTNNSEASAYSYAEVISDNLSVQDNVGLLNVVESLAPSLTDPDVHKRAKGTSLISQLMHCAITDCLNKQELEALVIFFCERLHDHHSIQPIVIYAFLGMVSYCNLSDNLVIQMLRALFAEVHVQSLIQADRHNVFNLFSNLLKTKVDVLKGFSTDFVLGFIQAMDSERDPRNLLICFQNSSLVLKHLDYSIFTEDFFEVLSCYYPIDFTPPTDMDFQINKEDLVLSLRQCLTCTDSFAEFAVPLYIEKISSDVMSAKKDSLITFTECLKIYSPTHVEPYITDIWLQIRKDYLLGEKSELSNLYLDFISRFMTCLYKSDSRNALDQVLKFFVKDCHQTLKDPDMTLALQCSEIFECVGKSSDYAYGKLIQDLLPALDSTIQKYCSDSQRKHLFLFAEKITAVAAIYSEIVSALQDFMDRMMPLYYEIVENSQDSKLLELTLRCVTNIIKLLPNLETKLDVKILAQRIFARIRKCRLESNVLILFESLCEALVLQSPEAVKLFYLDSICQNFSDAEVFEQFLKLLPHCSSNTSLEKYVFDCLLKLLHRSTTVLMDGSHQRTLALNALAVVLRSGMGSLEETIIFNPLIQFLFNNEKHTEDVLQLTGLNIAHAYQRLPNCVQGKICLALLNNLLVTSAADLSKELDIPIYSADSLTELLVLTTSVFSVANVELLKSSNEEELLCKALVKRLETLQNGHSVVVENIGISLARIVNHSPQCAGVLIKDLRESILNSRFPVKERVVLLCWVTKGLVLNWQRDSTQESIEILIALLRKAETTAFVADSFDIITADKSGIFTQENGTVIKTLHKQRLTQFMLPLLNVAYHNGGEATKASCMKAITLTLLSVPETMLKTHIKTLVPLLMNALTTFNAEQILHATLSTLQEVLRHNRDALTNHISSLTSRLLVLATHDRMQIRMTSLQSLALISAFPTYLVQPLKSDVLRCIRVILDDKKRLVRREAANCSNAWHLMIEGQ